jgi:hypothetical protein
MSTSDGTDDKKQSSKGADERMTAPLELEVQLLKLVFAPTKKEWTSTRKECLNQQRR